jgi:glycosyltransferase involved in cell wall biosynthesis
VRFFDERRKILIKTYCFESGLWYLAQSLYEELIREGHEVRFIPKSRYIKDGMMFRRRYPKPENPEDFPRDLMLRFSERQGIQNQILKYVVKYEIDTIISLETLMQKSNWIPYIKGRTGVQIVDVPMIEWVVPKYLNGMSYKIFDEVWTLTDFTHERFNQKEYRNLKRIDWDYVDRNLFFKDPNPFAPPQIHFYHAGSLNPDHSSKNTGLVIQAFDKLLDEGAEATLAITGKVTDKKLLNILDKHTNISVLDGVRTRQQIANLYRNMDCVIAPSSKEGLGLSLYEAEACGCDLITTDAPPMNSHNTKYLCKVSQPKLDGTLVPLSKLTVDSVYEQIKKVYEDNKWKIA